MTDNKQTTKTFLQKLWALGCSLKLAIALASTATLLIMAGSLVMHYNPAIFASMEQKIMGRWLPEAWTRAPLLVSWVPLSGLCVLLFAINTLCCLIDWLLKIKVRWRKTGEYLIHLGFILLTIAYLWGNTSGFRSGPHRIFPGEQLTIPNLPEYVLQLDKFTPQLEPSGRPLDMINKVTLWQGKEQVARATVRINHPLMHDGLVILPASFGQDLVGFRFHLPSLGIVNISTGSRLQITPETTLIVHNLLPDARQNRQGQVIQTGNRLNNPAMQISLHTGSGRIWQGWYFLRRPLPAAMQSAGAFLRPVEPVYRTYSLLTVNRDPGDKLALTGGICIAIGVIFAFFSFYRKRALGDRPEV